MLNLTRKSLPIVSFLGIDDAILFVVQIWIIIIFNKSSNHTLLGVFLILKYRSKHYQPNDLVRKIIVKFNGTNFINVYHITFDHDKL